MALTAEQLLALDRQYLWHPYASIDDQQSIYPVRAAQGCEVTLSDGRTLIDGMASWWCAIHGYNHSRLNAAIDNQLSAMAHVMFGGFTHEPAAILGQKLVELTPPGLERVFFADSGSVSIEVALKMAMQYWMARGRPKKQRIMSLRSGYHGDTFGAMSVCDPVTGMHHLFASALAQQVFVEPPSCRFGQDCNSDHLDAVREALERHHDTLAAFILEPIVQGAGGMRFYSPDYLRAVRELCDRYDVLLIADEIATGFGRSGRLFACEYADISPDILCLGKALTGGYMTLAATLCSNRLATTIGSGEAGAFMHGPTFMANPLACAVANTSIDLLLENNWQHQVRAIETQLVDELAACRALPGVADVRVLGAIGVVELHKPVDMASIVAQFVDCGIWVRPFGRLVYIMPPYVIAPRQLSILTQGIHRVLANLDGEA